MDIPLVSSQPLAGTSGINAVTAIDTLAIEQALGASPLTESPTTVDLSPLGRFLSAASLFQKKILALQTAAVQAGGVPDPDAVAAAALTLADAFTQLQANGIDSSSGATDQSFASLFSQQFGAQTVPADGSAPATPATPESLAAIGLNLVPAATPDQTATFSVDQPVLQAALNDSPTATTALLSQAAQAFATLAGVVPDAAPPAAAAVPAQPAAPQAVAAPAPSVAGVPNHDDIVLQQLLSDSAPRPAAVQDVNTAPALSAPDEVFVSEAQFLTLPPDSAAVTAGDAAVAPVNGAVLAAPASATLAIDPAIASVVNQALAAQALAARTASIAADDQAQDLRVQGRAAIDAQAAARADQLRTDDLAQQRRPAPGFAAAPPDLSAPLLAPLALDSAGAPQPAAPVAVADDVIAPVAPAPLQPDRAQQIARDPSIAAAIAAYNLNTGPFAALNGRPELAAPPVRTVPPVSTVAKVAAIDADDANKHAPRQSR